uniref:Uncharacterized protein n=1 Tax=Acrobeloides nanus TaxID=290746 RepID=A0A914DKF5_9BILA
MRVIRAFQAGVSSSHPNSLTTSAADRLRQSYRRLRMAKEREAERTYQLRNRGQIHVEEAEKGRADMKFV